jgi:hypothetical protein
MKRPVFVVGCPRSGTTLLYSLLVAAGGFAFYRKETFFFDVVRRFPAFSTAAARERFIESFLQGYLGKVPGLEVEPLVRRAAATSRTPQEFLPRLMNAITESQGMARWLEGTPAHVLYMQEIVEAVPDALFVHVIRDGRDVAISTDKQGWVPTLPWDAARRLGVSALFWEWMVERGRAYGRSHPANYLELRFEDLMADPPGALARVGAFIDHDLDWDRIQQNPVHAMFKPNTSFREERGHPDFNPVGRWKDKCSPDDLRLCEALVRPLLGELGYQLACPRPGGALRARARAMRLEYLTYFSAKQFLKARTPVGRVMTKTTAWAEQPRPGERPVRPIPEPAAKRTDALASW